MYDVLVIGGGPSALSEILRFDKGVKAAVVSDKFGGCLGVMGSQRLQSYITELTISHSPCDLIDFMGDKLESKPTGKEYESFIKKCFELIDVEKIFARVEYIKYDRDTFVLDVVRDKKHSTLQAKKIIIATGVRPKRTVLPLNRNKLIYCFDAYHSITSNKLERFEGADICVIGGGNSAFQLTSLLVRHAKSVTLLMKKYVGFYPIESDDRFALRAQSMQTIELVEKCANLKSSLGKINSDHYRFAMVYLHVFDDLYVNESKNELCADIAEDSNNIRVLKNSLTASIERELVYSTDVNTYRWVRKLDDILIVSATGVEVNTIPSPWHDLIDTKEGFIKNVKGKTKIDGLYVAGSAAGYKSVNQMQYSESLVI